MLLIASLYAAQLVVVIGASFFAFRALRRMDADIDVLWEDTYSADTDPDQVNHV